MWSCPETGVRGQGSGLWIHRRGSVQRLPCSVRPVNWGSQQVTERCWVEQEEPREWVLQACPGHRPPAVVPGLETQMAPLAVPPLGWRQNPEEWGGIPWVTAPVCPSCSLGTLKWTPGSPDCQRRGLAPETWLPTS